MKRLQYTSLCQPVLNSYIIHLKLAKGFVTLTQSQIYQGSWSQVPRICTAPPLTMFIVIQLITNVSQS